MRRLFTALLTVFAFVCSAYAYYGAKYEPPDGRTYHGVGWHSASQNAYQEMLPDSLQPLLHQAMTPLPGYMRRGGMTVAGLMRALSPDNFDHETHYAELSVQFELNTIRGDSTITMMVDTIFANTDQYDSYMDTLAIALNQHDRAMFLRIGLEMNGAWNGYTPWVFPRAFRKLVLGLRERNVDNFAAVWCYEPDAPDDFADSTREGWKWYPGDDVVDWFGLDPFDLDHFDPDAPDSAEGRNGWEISKKGKTEKFLRFAHERSKPVYLNELSARHVWITPHDEEVDSTHGEVDWNYWFEPFFRFMDNHPNIKAFNYINLDWITINQYRHWGDARLEINEYIRDHWIEAISDERYLHAGYEIPHDNRPPDGEHIVWTSANGVQDFEEWLTDDEAWGSVLENIDVFGFHENMFNDQNRHPLDPTLVAAFQRRTGKAVGIEAGGLRMHYGQGDTCGETGARRELALYGSLIRAGGSVDYLNLDSPIGYMLESNDGAYTPSEAARELADYIEIVNRSIPGMSIGINEPIPWYSVNEFPSHPGQDRGDLLDILDVLMDTLEARQLTIDYFNCDCPYDYTVNRNYNGFAKLIRIQEWCRENDLRFGVMYNSARGGARSDSLFYADVMAYYRALTDSGCVPDNMLIWSWYEHPNRALPETESYTFTYTVRDFMRAAGELTVDFEETILPATFSLEPPFPNPFNSATTIGYRLPERSDVLLQVFDLNGRIIETIVTEKQNPGSYSVNWNAGTMPTGLYFCRIEAGSFRQTGKLVLVK